MYLHLTFGILVDIPDGLFTNILREFNKYVNDKTKNYLMILLITHILREHLNDSDGSI